MSKKYKPLCSGWRRFPGGKLCKGCPDCGHKTNKNPYTTDAETRKEVKAAIEKDKKAKLPTTKKGIKTLLKKGSKPKKTTKRRKK